MKLQDLAEFAQRIDTATNGGTVILRPASKPGALQIMVRWSHFGCDVMRYTQTLTADEMAIFDDWAPFDAIEAAVRKMVAGQKSPAVDRPKSSKPARRTR